MSINSFKPGELYVNKSAHMTLYRNADFTGFEDFGINKPFMIISCKEAPSSMVLTTWILQILIDNKIKWTMFYPSTDEFIRLEKNKTL